MRKLFLTGFSAVAIGFFFFLPLPAQSALPFAVSKVNDFFELFQGAFRRARNADAIKS
jgi:hypothetical protein